VPSKDIAKKFTKLLNTNKDVFMTTIPGHNKGTKLFSLLYIFIYILFFLLLKRFIAMRELTQHLCDLQARGMF
jgi:hypothetical protein